MRNYDRLIEYLEANDESWGWKTRYERSLFEDGEINRSYLAGFYSSLLDDALSLIPPAFLEQIKNKDRT